MGIGIFIMIKRKWFTITYYQNDVRKWIGKSPYWSRIHVNQIDDKVYDRKSAKNINRWGLDLDVKILQEDYMITVAY